MRPERRRSASTPSDAAASTPEADWSVSRLHILAKGLSATFPPIEEAPLALRLLRLLADGEPVSTAALSARVGVPEDELSERLLGWRNVQRDDGGRVVGFAGLSLWPTRHWFHTCRRRLHTWCAWDTLFLPALLERQARVGSTCPITGSEIEATVAAEGVVEVHPDDVAVSFPSLAETDIDDITTSFCCHVHFLAGREAAERWRTEHPSGFTLPVRSAHELGAMATAELLDSRRG